MALAGRVIASHYAEPLTIRLREAGTLHAAPQGTAEPLLELPAGAEMRILDKSRGWAWGYAGGLVGYVAVSVL